MNRHPGVDSWCQIRSGPTIRVWCRRRAGTARPWNFYSSCWWSCCSSASSAVPVTTAAGARRWCGSGTSSDRTGPARSEMRRGVGRRRWHPSAPVGPVLLDPVDGWPPPARGSDRCRPTRGPRGSPTSARGRRTARRFGADVVRRSGHQAVEPGEVVGGTEVRLLGPAVASAGCTRTGPRPVAAPCDVADVDAAAAPPPSPPSALLRRRAAHAGARREPGDPVAAVPARMGRCRLGRPDPRRRRHVATAAMPGHLARCCERAHVALRCRPAGCRSTRRWTGGPMGPFRARADRRGRVDRFASSAPVPGRLALRSPPGRTDMAQRAARGRPDRGARLRAGRGSGRRPAAGPDGVGRAVAGESSS